jgi:hypothetical protein
MTSSRGRRYASISIPATSSCRPATWRGSPGLDLSLLGPEAAPRIVHASTAKLEAILPVPKTSDAVTAFLGGGRPG